MNVLIHGHDSYTGMTFNACHWSDPFLLVHWYSAICLARYSSYCKRLGCIPSSLTARVAAQKPGTDALPPLLSFYAQQTNFKMSFGSMAAPFSVMVCWKIRQ